jgi:heat-inducible transcriptional repressor
MADLFDAGYLEQPYTSAGRIPTEKAFRSYVKSLNGQNVLAAELHRLRGQLRDVETMEGRVERSSHILVQMTRGFGIAAAIPTLSQTLDQVDLLALADRRVLMVLATRDHMVRNRVVYLTEYVTQDELYSIRNYLNQNFGGWIISDIQCELEARLKKESAAYDAILKKLNLLYEKGLLEVGLTPEIHVEGASNLIGLDLHLTREKLRELFRALEQKKKILTLLDRFLEQPQGEVAVQVGLGEAHPAMKGLSLSG